MLNRIRSIIGITSLIAITAVAQENKLLGDGNDGNRSGPVHLLQLMDENGKPIRAADKDAKPFSTKQTCGQCHDYETISQGWHFNACRQDVPAGRNGQAWVLSDAKTRTQLPVSGRGWQGTFKPEQVGLTAWDFVVAFGSHFPGGGYGEIAATNPEQTIRQTISGKVEINCLACHHADPHQDQSLAAMQLARQNYRWASAASSGKAIINGVASELSSYFDPEFDEGIKTTYKDGSFDKDNMVFFDIVGKPRDRQCSFCHSSQNMSVGEPNEWTRDKDVHSAAGLSCTDCHRNGVNHQIARGNEDAVGDAETLSCKGCHFGIAGSSAPQAGRLGSPIPRHAGIPTIHFEKLTCTACHSGIFPDKAPGRWRTAQIHKLGLHGKHKQDLQLPHLYAPVMLKEADGRIGANYLFWPAFWATMEGDAVTPIPLAKVLTAAGSILSAEVERKDNWRPLTEKQVAEVLGLLSQQQGSKPVYIAGGKLYQLGSKNALQSSAHPAAGAYAWPMAHDVRPAGQSLGVRKCVDCHTTDSPFFFAGVELDSPIQGGKQIVEMVKLQGIDRFYMWAFNASFIFRPMLKWVVFSACGLIGLVLLIYGLKAIVVISNACSEETK